MVNKYNYDVSANKILNRIKSLLANGTPSPLQKEWIVNGFGGLKWNVNETNVIDFDKGLDYLAKEQIVFLKAEGIILNYKEKEGKNLNDQPRKIFISHSSQDIEYVKLIIKFLKEIGITANRIHCSSLEPYGVPADGDIFEWMKAGLTSDVQVIYILSDNFYSSPYCMCEMGATWVQAKSYIPIIIPPFNFDDIKGVIPLSKKAYKINDNTGLTGIKRTLEKNFNLEPIDVNIWMSFLEDYKLAVEKLIDESINKESIEATEGATTELETIEGQSFGVQQVFLDGKRFVNCTFDGSELVYKGEKAFSLESNRFETFPRIAFYGHAGITLNALKAMQKDEGVFREMVLKALQD
ncbi:toll/interleukin-1 receptor domain-containing protein [Priestia megaterium]|uniref:toll/interleukin-1 receptor domain-containing protein n=1 Tax=Priestia megaterium TaxID=1404 RepID=UPI001FB39CD1|nr:toll/interleukin-1 receptor domain-containing protein [Priestia megaterium]